LRFRTVKGHAERSRDISRATTNACHY
jgi:hypothetical protein